MRTLHVVSHTHWDREWYRTFQQFRLQLVHLVDGLLDLLEKDKSYKFFMLDGQTIILDDYLAMRPENEKILREHIRRGRILIGPWHILPDMFLVSPEAHIRNLLEGNRTASRFGSKMMIGYMPDSFGHFGQMPQMIRGFGMDVISLWRGPDDQPAEFWWQSPDGSRVLMAYLRDSYSNGASLNASNPPEFAAGLRRAADALAAHSALSDYLIMFGTDHMEPPRETSRAIAYANAALRGTKVIHTTLPRYVTAIQTRIAKEKIQLPVYRGELRSSKNSHLLPGMLSTRMWIKQRNQACETLLEKWAEPFSTFASTAPGINQPNLIHDPSSILHNAWRLLIQCHPHDSICGCSIDQVHEEMKARFDQAEQIGEVLTQQSLETLANSVQTSGRESPNQKSSIKDLKSAIVVFNPTDSERTDLVSLQISLPVGVSDFEILDEDGKAIPYQSMDGRSSDLINVNVKRADLGGMLAMVHEGRAGNLAVQQIQFERGAATIRVELIMSENGAPNLAAWQAGLKTLQGYIDDKSVESFHIHARSNEGRHVTFAAPKVPGFGWRTFKVRAKESNPAAVHITPLIRLLAPLASLPLVQNLLTRLTQPASRPPYRIENEFFVIEVNRDGTLTLADKRDGMRYPGLNRFVDSSDCGDEYNFCPPASDAQITSRLVRARVIRGPVMQRIKLDLELRVPVGLAPDRKSRGRQTVVIPITSRVTLVNGIPRLDIRTTVENRAKDHRLRVHFPAPFEVDSANYDGHFEIVNRKIGLPAFDETWAEQPRPEVPQRAFTDVSDGGHGLMVANRGLPEAEVITPPKSWRLRGSATAEIALTLLRCVGWLSRDDFPARRGPAGPNLETPAAQMQGKWSFEYSILPHAGDWKNAFEQAYQYETPMRAVGTDSHGGSLNASGSFVEVTPSTFYITAIKESEDGRGWLVRGVNLTDEPVQVRIKPWRKFKNVERVNLAEQKIGPLKLGADGEVNLTARGHEIVTVLFRY